MSKYLVLAAALIVLAVACNKKDEAPQEAAPVEQSAPATDMAPEAVDSPEAMPHDEAHSEDAH